MATSEQGHIGESVLRVEDDPLLRGLGCFLDAVPESPATVHLGFVRSPHPHAKINGIDASAAKALPGVVDVLTAEHLSGLIKPIQADFEKPGFKITHRHALATDRVRFVGDAVAVVLAETAYVVDDAVELVAVDYEPLPAVADIASALDPNAPTVHDYIDNNIVFEGEQKPDGFDAAFEGADRILEGEFTTARVAVVSMEARGCVASFDRRRGALTLWSSTQLPHILCTALCELLDFPDTKLQVIAPDVGGGFGMKAYVYPEELVAAALAIKHRGTFKWVQDRQDDFLASNHAREQVYKLTYAVDANAVVQAIKADISVAVGAYASFLMGSSLEANGGPRNLPGPYRFSQFAFNTRAVLTHTCPTGAFRGVSAPSALFAVEGMMDLIAKRYGLDPVEVRRRNLIQPHELPFTNAMGQQYDTGSHVECLDRALEIADYDKARNDQAAAYARDGKLRGIGVATVTEQTGQGASRYKARGLYRIPGYDSALIKIEPSGKALACISQATQGQGHLTAFAQIVAEELGLNVGDVTVVEGDTDVVPYGSGTFASRGAILGGGAAIKAAREVREKAKRIAAHLLEASPDDIELGDSSAYVAGVPKMRVSIAEVAGIAYSMEARLLPEDEEYGLEAIAHYDPPTATVSNAAHIAFVAVDPETGLVDVERYVVVHDCGRVINPMIVDGQVHGAISNGLGQVLTEGVVYSSDGQLLTASLLDYDLPTTADMPDLEVDHFETPSDITLGGFKGVGEGGVIGAVPALAGAVRDALSALGDVEVNQVPLPPDQVLAMIERARRSAAAAEG